MEVIIILGLIGIVIYFITSYNKSSNVGSTGKTDEKFINRTLSFFDGFISLCDNRSANGIFSLTSKAEESNWIEFEMQCSFFKIDGECAVDMLKSVKIEYSNIKNKSDNWQDASNKGDEYIKNFYCKEDLHSAFIDIEEYKFDDNCVTIIANNTLFTHEGAQSKPTLEALKKLIIEKYPKSKIKTYPNGIIINVD